MMVALHVGLFLWWFQSLMLAQGMLYQQTMRQALTQHVNPSILI
jgi:hypothetical protein